MRESTYQQIIVAVDLSKYSSIPMEKAIQLAAKYDARLHVVHVINMVMPSFTYSFASELQDTIYSEEKEHFASFCQWHGILKSNQHILVGSPAIQILYLANKLKSDLLVIGSHGEQRVLPLQFGCTATSVSTKAKCEVLTVPVHPGGVLEDSIPLQQQEYVEHRVCA